MSIQPTNEEPNRTDGLPDNLPSDFTGRTKLTREQCGHLRHFYNLASNLDGEWALMGTQEPAQEWLDGYRYQLATMAYGTGAAHYHRLPAMRTIFKPLMQKLITKMLRREVWGYWYLTSQSGVFVDPDLKEMRKPWPDPVIRENIMFGPEQFTYSRTTLQEAILAEMERNNWMGVCCEPNSVFVVCNQFPLIAMRYNDLRNGTNIAEEVLEKYKAAWAKKGMTSKNGLFREWYRVKQDNMMDAQDVSFTAWACAMMNSWNSSETHKMYPSLSIGFLNRTPDDRINVSQPQLANVVRALVDKEHVDPEHPETLARAREIVKKEPPGPGLPFTKPTFGYVAKWLSEVGEPGDLDALLRHADMFLNPTWANGGLYYPRCDDRCDAEGNWKNMDPFTGNAAIGYARLNVPDGQKIMWEHPWTSQQIASRPWIDGISMDNGVDALTGAWDAEKQMMVASWRTWDGRLSEIRPIVRNLGEGLYGVYVNGSLVEKRELQGVDDSIAVDLEIGAGEVELVVLKSALQVRAVL